MRELTNAKQPDKHCVRDKDVEAHHIEEDHVRARRSRDDGRQRVGVPMWFRMYLKESVYKVVVQNSIPAQTCQLNILISNRKQ